MRQSTMSGPTPSPAPDTARMPGHWLLARLGKRVLRPGGIELTTRMLSRLAIRNTDRVLELAPGLGATARCVLTADPASYIAVDRDADAVASVSALLAGTRHEVRLGQAHETGLPDGSRDVVLGEAMLTMNPMALKQRIVEEAYRVLTVGGRYAIHELSLVPDDMGDAEQQQIERDLSLAIHVGARPLTVGQWRSLLESAGFVVESVDQAPMHLLESRRFVQDEGLWRTVRFVWNLLRDRAAVARVREMREVFRRHESRMGAVAIVARKA
jgi:ubiquinone/menaquinone biosynthesis C-methylase UbiE